MSQFYDELCNMLIRPSRQKYQPYDLGNPIYNSIGRRNDFQLLTHHNLKLKCSYYSNLNNPKAPCIIYLHSFNGSRLESIRYSTYLLDNGFNFCAFDFAGCGNSEGEYVSLGYHQKYDIFEIIKHIYRNYHLCNFILWGRSMGASCIISFLSYLHTIKPTNREIQNITILSCILDSPFYSLNNLAIEIAQKRTKIPQILLKAVFMIIKNTVQAKADFKIDQLELKDHIHCIQSPVLILTSPQDTLVISQHSQDIYNNLKCAEKELVFIKGEHQEMRDNETINRVIRFIIKHSKHVHHIEKSASKIKQQSHSLKKSTLHQLTPTHQHARVDSNTQSPNQPFNLIYRTTTKLYHPSLYLERRPSINHHNNLYFNHIPNHNFDVFEPQENTPQTKEHYISNKREEVTIKLFQNNGLDKNNCQHFNVINNKLKKRKKSITNNHNNHSKTNQQFHKTYKPTHFERSIHQTPSCQLNGQCFQTHTFIPQPSHQINQSKSPKKQTQRVNTVGNLQSDERIDYTRRCKNAISMKNFGNSFRLIRPQLKQMEKNQSNHNLHKVIIKQRNKNQLKSSKKCINLKSPKKTQDFFRK